MSEPIRLPHRSIVTVEGEDTFEFLGGLVTNTLAIADPGSSRYAALLTPQGKVIADFLAFPSDGRVRLDCSSEVSDQLVRRLSMFKLRSRVRIYADDEHCAVAFTGAPDPRNEQAAARSVMDVAEAPDADGVDSYHDARIHAGLAEQSLDFGVAEVFPADINMDALAGVDFAKGCFVGQEVVSRMKRRGTARRRTILMNFDGAAIAGPVMAGEIEIGVVTSAVGATGLARVRIDRVAEAEAEKTPLTVEGVPVEAVWPAWLAGRREGSL